MADRGRTNGERVYCHSCAQEWDRIENSLTCPQCDSEFVEILSAPSSPRPQSSLSDHDRDPSPFPLPRQTIHDHNLREPNLRDHNPWQDDAPDPDEDDITTFEFSSRPGLTGSFHITSRTVRLGGGTRNMPGNRNRGSPNAANHPVMGGMGMFPFPAPGLQREAGFEGRTTFSSRVHHEATVQPGNFNDVFGMLMGALGGMGEGPQRNTRDANGPPPNPFAFLTQLLNPANAAHGDAVFSQEALDRVISQLMEQNAGSTAPPPASEAAIQALPTRKVDASMLGDEGKAECSICMEAVNIGEDVTVLPCSHWFHGACVTLWLKEHDTCPHCRQSIEREHGEAHRSQRDQTNASRPGTGRRSSSVSSPRSPNLASRLPQSPRDIREARQQYFGSRADYERPQYETRRTSRSESYNDRHNDRQQSELNRSGGRNNGGGGDGGNGVGGWLRNHNPFS